MTHTSFYKGSKIRVILRDGTQFVAKFVEKLGPKLIRVEVDGEKKDIRTADLRSCNYYKPWPHEIAPKKENTPLK